MRKYVWFLIAAAFALAIFAMVGCKPVTAPEASPSPSPETPTPSPDTTPPAVKSTVVSKVSSIPGWPWFPWGRAVDGLFRIRITFDEPIDSGCIENPENWRIQIKNRGRADTDIDTQTGDDIEVLHVSVNGSVVDVYVWAEEAIAYWLKAITVRDFAGNLFAFEAETLADAIPITKLFLGLLCSENDAEDYSTFTWEDFDFDGDGEVEELGDYLPEGVTWDFDYDNDNRSFEIRDDMSHVAILDLETHGLPKPTAADNVVWTLSSNCVVCDELGNCKCGYTGQDCCLEPACEECVEECPIGGGVCP